LKSKLISALGGIGLGLTVLAASCSSGEIDSTVLFTTPSVSGPTDSAQETTPVPLETGMSQATIVTPIQPVEVKMTPEADDTLAQDTAVAFPSVPASIETDLHRGASVTPSPLLEATPSPASDEPEVQIVALINHERTSRDLSTLTVDPRLMRAAQGHSQDMARNNFFDHIGSDGSNPGDRISREDYSWTFFAENLGCGYPTAEAMLKGWLDSSGHRANMLAPEAAHIGVGLAYDPDTDCGYYWTGEFAAGG
jgi:uncharacterized protein YkwD